MAVLFAYRSSVVYLIIFAILIFYSATVSSQILKRYKGIKGWAQIEEKIFDLSKARVKKLKLELSELEKFVDDYEKTTSQHLSGIKDPKLQQLVETNEDVRAHVVASNALLTYRMTHRLSTMLPRMQKFLLTKDPQTNELKGILGSFTDAHGDPDDTLEGTMFGEYAEWLPNEDDLEAALDAMTVLYDVYNPNVLEPNDFAAMLSIGTTSPVEINAYHATKFSLKAFYHGYYGNALDWAKYANNKLEDERDYSISKEFVRYIREFVEKSHDEEFSDPPSYFPETIPYLNFFTERVNETKSWTKRKSKFQQMLDLGVKGDVQVLATSHYYTVCQNARLQMLKEEFEEETLSRLACNLDRNINPYFYLAPLKVETLSEFPRVLQVYDVFSPLELETVLEKVIELQFEPSYPFKDFPDQFGTRTPHLRTVMDAVIDKQTLSQGGSSGILSVLARKLEYLKRFRLVDGEKHNDVDIIASEFVGGGYEAIQRISEEKEVGFGGGIQLFLQVPEEGGETVVGGTATTGKFIKPVSGSILFWENIGSEANTPVNILLGSCPVVQGHKIVLTKEFY